MLHEYYKRYHAVLQQKNIVFLNKHWAYLKYFGFFLPQHSLEQAENLIKQHEAFITTMDANDEKINNVLQFAQRLIDENHYAADKVQQKADNINER